MAIYRLLKKLPNYAVGKDLVWSPSAGLYVNKDATSDGVPVRLSQTAVDADTTWFSRQVAVDILAAITLLTINGYTVTGP